MNGDWASEREVQHFCRGCCSSEEDTKSKFVTTLVALIAKRAPRTFKRNRWTQADEALQAIRLLSCIHGLLRPVFCEWARSYGTKVPARLLMQDPAEQLLALEDDPENMNGLERAVAANLAAAEDAAGGGDKDDSAEAYRRYLAGVRQKALVVVCMENFVPRLVVLSLVMRAQQDLMREYLLVTGDEWDTEQEAKLAAAQRRNRETQRECRVFLACKRALTSTFLARLATLLSDSTSWRSMPRSGYSVQHTALAFRLLSCAGAVCYRTLHRPHAGYPWKCWAIAANFSNVAMSEALEADPNCLFDTWTKHFVTKFEGRLDTEDARMHALATSLQIQSDNASIEARRGHIRRRVLVASTQTHCQKLSHASSEFVLRQVLGMSAPRSKAKVRNNCCPS